MTKVHDKVINYSLLDGYCPETSGGLLVILKKENVDKFQNEFKEITKHDSWIIGEVVEGNKRAYLEKVLKIIDVS